MINPIGYWLSGKNNMGVKGLETGLLFGYVAGNCLLSFIHIFPSVSKLKLGLNQVFILLAHRAGDSQL